MILKFNFETTKLTFFFFFFLFLFSFKFCRQLLDRMCIIINQHRAISYRPQRIPKPRPHGDGLHDGWPTRSSGGHDASPTSWRRGLRLPSRIRLLRTPVVLVRDTFVTLSRLNLNSPDMNDPIKVSVQKKFADDPSPSVKMIDIWSIKICHFSLEITLCIFFR